MSVDRNNFVKWHDLVKEFTQHVVDRYGIDEVLTWYFEVWNEPNLNLNPKAGFFDGTKSDYFRLYKESVNAIKSVDNRLKVGGPATSNFIADERHDGEIMDHKKSVFYSQDVINTKQWKGVWIEDFLRYCEKRSCRLILSLLTLIRPIMLWIRRRGTVRMLFVMYIHFMMILPGCVSK